MKLNPDAVVQHNVYKKTHGIQARYFFKSLPLHFLISLFNFFLSLPIKDHDLLIVMNKTKCLRNRYCHHSVHLLFSMLKNCITVSDITLHIDLNLKTVCSSVQLCYEPSCWPYDLFFTSLFTSLSLITSLCTTLSVQLITCIITPLMPISRTLHSVCSVKSLPLIILQQPLNRCPAMAFPVVMVKFLCVKRQSPYLESNYICLKTNLVSTIHLTF